MRLNGVRHFLIIALFAPLSSPFISAEPLAENQARFGRVEGDVGLLPVEGKDWIEPREGMPIDPGDQVRTADDGRVELVLSEHMLVIVGSSTHVAAERADANSGIVNLTQGTLIGKLDSAAVNVRQDWEFKTPVAVCGVRGTEFAIEASRETGMRLGVFEGEVDVQEAEGPQGMPPLVRVGARQEAFVARGKPLQRLDQFSPGMVRHWNRRTDVRVRQVRVKKTWTPFTPAVRIEHRRKYVVPVKIKKRSRPAARRRAKPERPQNQGF